VEGFRQRDGVDCCFPVLLSQVDHAWPERHLDLDECLIAVGQQVLGLARVDAHDTKQQVA